MFYHYFLSGRLLKLLTVTSTLYLRGPSQTTPFLELLNLPGFRIFLEILQFNTRFFNNPDTRSASRTAIIKCKDACSVILTFIDS